MNTAQLIRIVVRKRCCKMSIRLLEDHLINKIAAGEVIERPASVVKELLENAVDAGASRIMVSISGGGLTSIEVEDNGGGISYGEVPMALLRHATSKIKEENDLFAINTMGFRGEALPSIASVSRMTIFSRSEGEEGVLVRVEAGKMVQHEIYPCPQGTRIVVDDLFYNTPARRKFIKSPVAEGIRINELVSCYALAWPEISFSLRSEKKQYFKTPGNGVLLDTLTCLYGGDFAQYLTEIDYRGTHVNITGLISSPEFKKVNRKQQQFFVNRRPVKSPLLFRAVDTAYRGKLLTREYPVCFLSITIPPAEVDVNVHPQKSEVRFQDEKGIFHAVFQVIEQKLKGGDYQYYSPQQHFQPASFHNSGEKDFRMFTGEVYAEQSFAEMEKSQLVELPISAREADSPLYLAESNCNEGFRIIGQYGNSYILVEMEHALWIIDQHAAHERIIFSRLLAQDHDACCTQDLVFPQTVQLSGQQIRLLEEQQKFINSLGFLIEPMGHQEAVIRSVPAMVQGHEQETVHDLLDLLAAGEKPDLEREVLASMSCKSAVKAGEVLNRHDMENIVRELLCSSDYKYCPHGRPTIIRLADEELRKMFKR